MEKRDLNELRRTPAYPFVEAAHYLNLPVSTLRAWCLGQDYDPNRKTKRFVPLIALDGPRRDGLSFFNLVEAHVLVAIRRTHEVSLLRIRDALLYVADRLNIARPLLDATFQTDGLGIFVEELGRLINVTRDGQIEIEQCLREHLYRIQRDLERVPIKLFPFIRAGSLDRTYRPIEIDPTIAFGRPVIRGRAVPTAVLADRFKAGDSIRALSEDLEIEGDVIEDAIRCELERAAA